MTPFVLIDDARPGGTARLYRDPTDIIAANAPGEVAAALDRLRTLDGRHAAGFLAYEAGHALERKLAPIARPIDGSLVWFGLFDDAETVSARDWLPDAAGGWSGKVRPRIAAAEYETRVERILEHIFAGDIYQANLTFQADVPVAGHPLAIYAAIRERAGAGHGAIVFTGRRWLLSFSPELFFTLEDRRVVTRPMKGTAVRKADAGDDAAAAEALAADPKQRAENLMIVDLLRNDLSRVARPGTVDVPALFAVETYPTVHQMTSTVTAQLEDGVGIADLLRALYPCGSITGAPKIRAMEIIDAVEAVPRGVYTGAIGSIAPDGAAAFNVVIRTLVLEDGAATLGLGSGIVADSRPADEWRECLAKGAFVEGGTRFDLIETMRFDPAGGVQELDRHLARMKASAEAFDFAFDRHAARNELQAATFRLRDPRLVRLRLSPTGTIAVEVRKLPDKAFEPVPVKLVPLPVPAEDFRLRHKTSDRSFYDAARRAAGTFEVLFHDEDGHLTEGSFTSLFVERGGKFLTPRADRGLLPGVLRARMLDAGEAVEADLGRADLSDGFWIGNIVRGLIRARLVR